jgi:hypothetical protein
MSFVSPGKESHRPDAVTFFCPRECPRNMLDRSARKHERDWWPLLPEDAVGLMILRVRIRRSIMTTIKLYRVTSVAKRLGGTI